MSHWTLGSNPGKKRGCEIEKELVFTKEELAELETAKNVYYI